MIDRRLMTAGLAGWVCGLGRAQGQSRSRVPRIGYMAERGAPNEFEEAFLRGLRDRGLVAGESVIVDFRFSAFDKQRAQDQATELMAAEPAVVVASDTTSVRAVQRIDATMAIVHPAMADPIVFGYTSSLARPDRNLTGVSVLATELGAKRVELLKQAVPELRRVGVLFNALRPLDYAAATRAAAEALGLTAIDMHIAMPDGIDPAFTQASHEATQGVVVVSDTSTITYRAQLSGAAARHRIPTMYANRTYLRGGGLMSYGPDLEAAFYRAAYYAERIVKGARPADLPIEQATTFQLVINQRAAKAIDFKFPQALLARADEVIN